MAASKDLIDAVRTSLDADGELCKMKAEMRTKVMKLLEGSSKTTRSKLPKSPLEISVVNELIREYLDWIGYKYAANVLVAECEMSKQPLHRDFIIQNLGVIETEKTKGIPLLFCIVEAFKESKGT